MEYPKDFPQGSRARVHAAEAKAQLDFANAKRRLQPPRPEYLSPEYETAVEKLVRRHIFSVVFAFAHEAIRAARKGLWQTDNIQSNVKEYGERLIEQARRDMCQYDSGYSFQRVQVEVSHFHREAWQGIEGSERWVKFLIEVAEVAELQARTAGASNQAVGERVMPNPSADLMAKSDSRQHQTHATSQTRKGYRTEVRDWMKRVNLDTVEQAARKLGVSEATLKSIMSDKGKPRYGKEKLNQVLRVIGP